jgi:hypothetical protein
MLGVSSIVALYYLAFGFAILLAWAIAVPDRTLDAAAARRYLRWAALVAPLGLAHPALAWATKDVVDQVGVELDEVDALADDDLTVRHRRVSTATNATLALSALLAATIVALGVL